MADVKMRDSEEVHELDSDEDEVVAEFDICLAGSLREQLQLL